MLLILNFWIIGIKKEGEYYIIDKDKFFIIIKENFFKIRKVIFIYI